MLKSLFEVLEQTIVTLVTVKSYFFSNERDLSKLAILSIGIKISFIKINSKSLQPSDFISSINLHQWPWSFTNDKSISYQPAQLAFTCSK